MSSRQELVAALQLDSEQAAQEALSAVKERGIAAQNRMLCEVEKVDRPDWVDEQKGGTLLYVEKNRFDEAMSRLEKVMGGGE
jgi:hypothetical protein